MAKLMDGSRVRSDLVRLAHERQRLLDQAAAIDAQVFQPLGLDADQFLQGSNGKKAPVSGRPNRGSYQTSNEDEVFNIVKGLGGKGVLSNKIADAWKATGRRTAVYVVLSKLVREKRLTKGDGGGRQSSYTVAK